MIIINYNCNNSLEWTVFKGLSKDVEDFTRSKVMLFAISETNKIPLAIESKDDGCIKATIPAGFEIPTGLTAQTYDTELIWIKNGRDVNRTYQYNVFKVDTSSTAQEQTVRIKSTAQVYGYDGLSAYEIAMMKAENPKSENEWLRNLLLEKADRNGNSSEDFSANNIIVQNDVVAHNDVTARRIVTEIIKNPNDLTSHSLMVPTARSDAEYILTTSDGKRYGCYLSYSDKKIKLLGDSGQELSFIEAYDKQDADNIFEDLADRIDQKADANTVYTKGQIDNQMAQKANVSYVNGNFATKTSIESLQLAMNQAETAIDNIEDTIPSLATKEFVNSSISTNTATFRGSYNLVTDLKLAVSASRETIARNIPNVVSSADNNDYAFIQIPTSDETPTNIARVERYKFNGSEWAFEYELNNSGFTAEQWAAISSGVTTTHVQKVNGIDAELAGKQDVLTFDSTPTANSFNPVTSNGLYIALQNILSTSGGTINGTLTMHGNIDMLMDAQHSWNRIKTTTGRNLFCFKNGFNGYMIGDESVKLGIETGSIDNVPTPIYHRITINGQAVDRPLLDTYNLPANVKTINGTSVAGSGNIDIDDAFKVVYGVTPMADVVNAYLEGKHIYAVKLDYEENFNTANVFILYAVSIDDINNTDHKFAFSQYYADGNDISYFELTNDGYSEIYYSTVVTTGDLTAALSDYTTTSDLTTLLNNKQNTVDSNHKLSADVIDDSSTTNKFVTSSDKTIWNTVTEKAPLPFVVTCGIDPSDRPFVNSTLDEIWTARQNGKNIRVKFAKADGVAFEDDATMLLDGSRNCVAHTVHNGTHYIVTIYDDNGTTKLSYEETYDTPEIVNLTDGEHSSGYYEDLMRTVGILKLDSPQIFIYTAYNNNHIATTAMCFSTCTNTETPTSNAVVKQTLFLGTYKSTRTLSNTVSGDLYQVVTNWEQIVDVKQSDLDAKLSKSGGSMTGDLDLNSRALLVKNTGGNARYGIRFTGTGTREGVYVGNPNMRLFLEADATLDLVHKKGNEFLTILDTGNVKTINGNSIHGSGNLDIGIVNYEGVVSQTQTWTVVNPPLPRTYTMSNIVRGNVPKAFVDLVEPYGAIFNQTTGYFELNGLTDISYEEMRAIYNHGTPRLDSGYFFYGTSIRTNIFCNTYRGDVGGNWFARASEMEVINLHPSDSANATKVNNGTYTFYNCTHLKEIKGPIAPLNWVSSGAGASPFKLCYNLESLQFKGMTASVDFDSSTLLSLDSVVYMVQNAANTSAITITLHSTAYQRCVNDTNTYEYQGTTYTGIIALANAKNITIASA